MQIKRLRTCVLTVFLGGRDVKKPTLWYWLRFILEAGTKKVYWEFFLTSIPCSANDSSNSLKNYWSLSYFVNGQFMLIPEQVFPLFFPKLALILSIK